MFEMLHFRDADKILKKKHMLNDVKTTLEYIGDVLSGVQFKGELFRQALEEMGWRENGTLNILEGRRYLWKGLKKSVAIEGSFAAYEFILEGLLRLQIGFDKGMLETGILLLTSKRSEKSPYGSTSKMVKEEIEMLYPTISLPVTVVLFDLDDPEIMDDNGSEAAFEETGGTEHGASVPTDEQLYP
ncbi:hypothetical protein ACFL0M_11780 [Thermodesulfobacteriota bacterium]